MSNFLLKVGSRSQAGSSAPIFIKKNGGDIEIQFPKSAAFTSESSASFPTELNTCELWNELILKAEPMKILYFLEDGSPVYQGRDETCHIIWYDVCYCDACEEDQWEDEEKKPKRMSFSQRKHQQRYEADDPIVDLLGEPSGKFDFFVIYGDEPPPKIKTLSPCKPDIHQNYPRTIKRP